MTLKDRKKDPPYLFVLGGLGGPEVRGGLALQGIQHLQGNHAGLWDLGGPVLGDPFLLECPWCQVLLGSLRPLGGL